MVQYEMVLELREFLNEHVYTCFYTHYHFEHAGVRLNDYTELVELDLASDNKIYLKPGMIDYNIFVMNNNLMMIYREI